MRGTTVLALNGARPARARLRRAILRRLLLWCWLIVPAAGFAASGDEFYQRLHQRGMAHFAAGDYAAAFTELRNAAFGFVEQVEKFETVQAYASVAAHRLGHDNDARDSLMRIVAAEKIQPHFRSAPLPDDIRVEATKLAAALLTEQEAKLLGVTTEALSAAAAKSPVTVPTPTKRPNVAITAPRDSGSGNAAPPPPAAKPAPPKEMKPAPQPQKPAPQPVVPMPQPKPPQPKPVAPAPQPVVPVPQPMTPAPQPVSPAPKQEAIKPQPQPPSPMPQPVVKNADTSLAEAQRAVDDGDINRARSIYSALLNGPPLAHLGALRLAEGMYRVRDFAGAARAFARAGVLDKGEERYHYNYAVALYETGRYRDAKRELAAALPYIQLTTDVARYRAKIEGAIE